MAVTLLRAPPSTLHATHRASPNLEQAFYIDDLFDLASQLESNAQLECMFEVFLAISAFLLAQCCSTRLLTTFRSDPQPPRAH